METGTSQQLLAYVTPADATDPTVSWSSSNPAVLSVDANGTIKAVSQGTARITITTNDGGYTSICNVGVLSTGIAVTGISISECPSMPLNIDSSFQLADVLAPPDAGDQTVYWSSSNTTVAQVDDNGMITAISRGNSTITAITNDGVYTDECIITVGSVSNENGFMSTSEFAEVYPNPASNLLYIKFSDHRSDKKINVYNLYGQLLLSKISDDSNVELDIREFRSDSFVIVEVISGFKTESFKVILDKSSAWPH